MRRLAPRILLLAAAVAFAPVLFFAPAPADALAPDELAELERMAEDSFAQDDLASAVALYRQLAERHGEVAEKVRVMTTVAWLEHLRGRPEAARSTLTDVLVLYPGYAFRAELYNDTFTALFYDAQKRALEVRESTANRRVREGADQLRNGDYGAARASFRAALDTWAEQPKAIYNLALVDYYEDQTDAALAGFEKVLALAAARPELVGEQLRGLASTNLGLIYLQKGQDDEAARLLEEAVRLDGRNATAWSNLSLTRRRQGDAAGAAVAARKAIEIAPDDAAAHRSLAIALLDAGRPAEAAEQLRDSTTRFPEDGGLWLYLGLAERRLGQSESAAAALRRAVDRDAQNGGGWAAPAALQLAALAYEGGDDRGALA
ncbi:MAG: tetratricopeptide repeat protein, partial [Acidobacteriota bacterium]